MQIIDNLNGLPKVSVTLRAPRDSKYDWTRGSEDYILMLVKALENFINVRRENGGLMTMYDICKMLSINSSPTMYTHLGYGANDEITINVLVEDDQVSLGFQCYRL